MGDLFYSFTNRENGISMKAAISKMGKLNSSNRNIL